MSASNIGADSLYVKKKALEKKAVDDTFEIFLRQNTIDTKNSSPYTPSVEKRILFNSIRQWSRMRRSVLGRGRCCRGCCGICVRGFTLIEVVVVLLLLGIIAAAVVSRMSDTTAYDLFSQREAVKAHLRLAQSRAMASSSPWGINFNSATTYYLFQGAGSTTPVRLLGEDNATVSLTAKGSGLTVSSAPRRITFDAYGSPGATTVTIATNGGNITVTKNTGFIP